MRRGRVCRAALTVAMIVALVGSVTACSGSGEPEAPPTHDVDQWYIDQVDEYVSQPGVPEFLSDVLADYWISDAELQEGKDRFYQCIESEGYEAKFELHGRNPSATLSDADHKKLVERYQDDPDAGLMKEMSIVDPCWYKSLDFIAEFYVLMRENPKHETNAEWMRRCLEKAGAADKARSIPDDEVFDAVTSGKLGDDVKEHCQNYVYQE